MDCRLCSRSKGQNTVGEARACHHLRDDGDCNHHEYKGFNGLCARCTMDCKQPAHVIVSVCYQYKRLAHATA